MEAGALRQLGDDQTDKASLEASNVGRTALEAAKETGGLERQPAPED